MHAMQWITAITMDYTMPSEYIPNTKDEKVFGY
jgi:hypothetical protein